MLLPKATAVPVSRGAFGTKRAWVNHQKHLKKGAQKFRERTVTNCRLADLNKTVETR